MEAPVEGRSGAGEEEDEDFHDCPEVLDNLNGDSEEEFVILEKEQPENDIVQQGAAPFIMEKGDPSAVTGEKGDPSAESVEAQPAPFTIEEEGGLPPVMEGEAEEAAEWDEDALLEMEKDMSEEEREDRRKASIRLKEEGNELFKKADYVTAEEVYCQALQKCPAFYKKDRAILFSNRAAARGKQDKKDLAIKDCTKALELNPDYVRALLRRAELYEKTEKLDEALADYQAILQRDASCHQAREACMRLPKQIEERNEKMKDEMLSKLKDLGNLVLKPFGLSTANFQVNQDAQTGSYSVNFVQNRNNNR